MKTEQMTSVAADLKSKIENKTACIDMQTRFIEFAGEIHQKMPIIIIDRVTSALNASLVIDIRNALAGCNNIRARLVKA
jgi:hypothetical protein